jgi:hypothetical protein
MKKSLLAVAFATFLMTGNVRAELQVTAPVVNLGEIRGGPPADVTFILRNGGAERIEILEVNRDCNCLTPRLDKRLLEPGQTARLDMAVRTLGHPDGQRVWNTTIRYREGASLHDAFVAVRAAIVNEVKVQPAVCALFVEKAVRQEIVVTDVRKPPLTVTRAETSSTAVRAEVVNVAAGVTKIILEARGSGLAPGRYDETLSIFTNDSGYGSLQVPVTLVRASESPVLVTPDEVQIVAELGKPIPSALVRLRPRGEGTVVIDKIVANDPALSCKWAAGPGTHATLRIEAAAAQPLETTLRVYLRQPVEQVLSLPVRVMVR